MGKARRGEGRLCLCRAVMIPKGAEQIAISKASAGHAECDNLICILKSCILCTKILGVANIFLERNCTYKRKRL